MIRSSHLEAKELVYINQHIDKLLHITSLYLTSPSSCNSQLQQLLALCTPHSFFCSLCNFAVNITQSCQQLEPCMIDILGIYLVITELVNLSLNSFLTHHSKSSMKCYSKLTFSHRFSLRLFLIIPSPMNLPLLV